MFQGCPGSPVVGTRAFTSQGRRFNPGQETNILGKIKKEKEKSVIELVFLKRHLK